MAKIKKPKVGDIVIFTDAEFCKNAHVNNEDTIGWIKSISSILADEDHPYCVQYNLDHILISSEYFSIDEFVLLGINIYNDDYEEI